ncbi:multi-sensor signal transduction [Clostridium sp. IBUN22A]|uniref:sensor histidine kinase n=1 Tax=Clostridium sp. IBUN22A TaxID=1523155 RepID=UPI00061F40D6|nr:ABC transporter substrate binding protein [Clostridium sp. IBUN22A]KJZ95519.1 multi-sensor signal transduction [Clostridium sp. IBUN22A]
MKLKVKNIRLIVLVIFFTLISNYTKVSAYVPTVEGKNILVIGSYSFQNEWEESVLSGFESILGDKNNIKSEYLDSYSKNTFSYHESFLNYLDAKYENQNIDYIFTMDDEALKVIRDHMFEKHRVFYKKPVFFVGVNSIINLNDEEKKYLSGVVNIETCLECVDLIEKMHGDMKKLYVLCDNSLYSQSIMTNISAAYHENNDKLKTEVIKTNKIGYMKKELAEKDFKDSVILICGAYINETTNSKVSSSEVIESIKNITDAPIYTTLYNYVESGAVGGVVNDGEKTGRLGAILLNSVVNGDSVEQFPYIMTPSYNSINTSLFNYKVIREYNINPLNIPEGSSFINKKPYNLLLPKWSVFLIYISFSIVVFLIIYLAVIAFYHKRKIKMFLLPKWSVFLIYISFSIVVFLIIYLAVIAFYHKRKIKEANLEAVAAIEREKIKTDYIILMSHEFRTPLNIIINSTKFLKRECINNNYDKEYFITRLNNIIKNSNRLNKAVNNSIDVAKIEAGIMSIDFKMYNIVKVVEDITETIIDFAADLKYRENYA